MSKPTKASAGSAGKPADLPFEAALEKLEHIVDEMESDELPLETLLARFEEGSRLAAACQAKLADAELKIRKLEQAPDGALELKPFDTPPAEPV